MSMFSGGDMNFLKSTSRYVRLKLWGNGMERFLVLCTRKKMPLWDIEAQGKYIFTNMRLKDFYNCRQLARKAGVRAVVVERHGLPFVLGKIKRRSLLIAGFLVFVIGWIITANMLLHIQVKGNYSITEDVLQDFLEEQGIYVGMWKKNIRLEQLEKAIRERFEQVTWTSGKFDGTVLIIDLKEYDKPITYKQLEESEEGSSLYATAAGIIEHIYVRNGIPLVKKGTEVQAGDLLVDGRVPVYREDQTIERYQSYKADADIGIETYLDIQYELPAAYVQKQFTGREYEGKFIFVGSKVYRFKWKERNFVYKDVSYEMKKHLGLKRYSVGMGNFLTKEYINMEKLYTAEQAKRLLTEEFEKNNRILLQKGVQILEKDVTIEHIMDKWVLSGKIKVIMPAFEERPMETFSVEDAVDAEGL